MLASGCGALPQQWNLHTPDRHDASDNAAHSNPGVSNVVVVVVVKVVVVVVFVIVVVVTVVIEVVVLLTVVVVNVVMDVVVAVVDEMLVVVAVVVVAVAATAALLAAPSAHRADWLPSYEGPANVAPDDTDAGPLLPPYSLWPHTVMEPSSFNAANA